MVSSCEYCEIFKNTYSEEHLREAGSGLYTLQRPLWICLTIILLLRPFFTGSDLLWSSHNRLLKRIYREFFHLLALHKNVPQESDIIR